MEARRQLRFQHEVLEDRHLLAGLTSHTGSFIPTHADPWIPNFVESTTFRSACEVTCFWDSATSWSEGRVPTASDRVIIDPGDEVVIRNTQATAEVVAVDVGGKLSFSPTSDTQLGVVTLLVLGELEMGTQAQPISAAVTAGVTFLDVPIDLAEDPGQYGHGLLALNSAKVRVHGAALSETFVRLAKEPLAGDNSLVLEQAPSGWRAGDSLVVPDTRQIHEHEKPGDGNYVPQWEEVTIAGINGDVITLAAPLQFDHLGARDGDGHLDFLAHVMNRSRNVVLQSANPDGTRGHTLFQGRSDIDIRYASFRHLGRTENVVLDNTTYDENGHATHVGTNQIARYAIHTHHLVGPTTPQSNGYQFTLLGNSVDNGTLEHNFKWGIAIHGSHYGLISQNTVYNVAGAAIVTEDGTESYNVFERNFVVRAISRGDESRYSIEGNMHTAREATGFWFRGPLNYVRDNVAANVVQYGKALTSYGFKYLMRQLRTQTIPAYQGAMPAIEGTPVHMNQVPLLEFDGNEAYGAIEGGLTYWWVGANSNHTWDVSGTTVIKDFHVWHAFNLGIYAYQSNRVTIDGLVVRGADPQLSACCTLGFHPGDYVQKDLVIKNSDIQGMRRGIDLPEYGDGVATIENTYLRNLIDNVRVRTHFSSIPNLDLPIKSVVIRNTQFELWNNSTLNINMHYQPRTNSNVVLADDVYVYSYNGVAGDDFRVQYLEQAPDYIVPQSGSQEGLQGSPEAGLTNQQNWDQYGIAIAGSLATTSLTRPAIHGLVTPLGNGNHGPVTNADRHEISSGTATPAIGNVLSNDFDLNGDRLDVIEVNADANRVGALLNGQYGMIRIDADGSYAYTLDLSNPQVQALPAGASLTESFNYTVSDGAKTSSSSLTIVIEQDVLVPPLDVRDDAAFISSVASGDLTNGNVLTNDLSSTGTKEVTAVNGNPDLVEQVVSGAYGTLQLNRNGSFLYTLDKSNSAVLDLPAGQSIFDDFSYTMSNGSSSGSAQLRITIRNDGPANQIPTPQPDSLVIIEDSTPEFITGNVLDNDVDADGDDLSVTRVNGLWNRVGVSVRYDYGDFVVHNDGSYVYTLDNSLPAVDDLSDDETLTEAFSYTVSDGVNVFTSYITVEIRGVNDAQRPTARDDVVSVWEDATLVAVGNALANDGDPDNDELVVVKMRGSATQVGTKVEGQFGTWELHANGFFRFTLNNEHPAVDSLDNGDRLAESVRYTISDSHGTATARLIVLIYGSRDNNAPRAVSDFVEAVEDSANMVSGNLLANDSDQDGETLVVEDVDGHRVFNGTIVEGSYGELEVEINGDFIYRLDNSDPVVDALDSGDELIETYNYTVSDGAKSDLGTLTVRIRGADDNQPPRLHADVATVIEDEPSAIAAGSVLANDGDPDGDQLFVERVMNSSANVDTSVAGQYGTLTLQRDGYYLYELDNSNPAVDALNDDQVLLDTFDFTVSDGHHSVNSVLTIRIQGHGMIGDVNEDGRFDSSDLLLVFQMGEYADDVADNSTFAEGDWNGDGDFDSDDLILAFQQGNYDKAAVDRVMLQI